MQTASRLRRFVPMLDSLPSRLVMSADAGAVSPMDPALLNFDDTPTTPVVVSPMDPTLLGFSDTGSDPNIGGS